MSVIRLPRVCPVVVRTEPGSGCPRCERGPHEMTDRGTYCEECGVFRCPVCLLWRFFDDGGGDDAACNDCWALARAYRLRAAARLARSVRARRWRRRFADRYPLGRF